MDEFSLIRRYFDVQSPPEHVVRGIGDDTAIIDGPSDRQLLITTDTLVSGIHFFPDADPASIGHKALAVNLSDIAAMGGTPTWFTLALTLPEPDESWLQAFSSSMMKLAKEKAVALVGGDTTRGPLSVTITMIGTVAAGQAVCREGAQIDDAIVVTGTLGDAALALHCKKTGTETNADDMGFLNERLELPVPRLEEGMQLAGQASAMIDVSDGLSSDLGHILSSSKVGAEIYSAQLPMSDAMQRATEKAGMSAEESLGFVLSGGDDYELCATVPESRLSSLLANWPSTLAPLTPIGSITSSTGLVLRAEDGSVKSMSSHAGYNHFNDR